MLIEKWSFMDALYMTVITLATVGYGEVRRLSPSGRIFTMLLILTGVGFVFYVASSTIRFVVEGRVREILGRRKLEKEIQAQKNHYIICGYGRVGSNICDILASRSMKTVVIERAPERISKLNERNLLYIAGEATDEENLLNAGVERARGLVAVLKTDTDNVYVTLSARQLNPELFIIARAGEKKSENKLLAAGADKVISPYRIGAQRIAQTIIRPTVTDFLELAVMDKSRNIQMEELPVHSSSGLVGVALQDSGIRKDYDLIIVAIRRAGGEMLFNPSARTKLQAGDTVIAIGEKQNLEGIEKVLNPLD
ncbi:MAG: potassium channel protein [Deltaproteobacteria bacterium]|nr:potassium channel protein [Deltaproteobacteria bacterium]RLB90661.1 MAG: potassium channel protein [Deltaproteobacteria bacterium]